MKLHLRHSGLGTGEECQCLLFPVPIFSSPFFSEASLSARWFPPSQNLPSFLPVAKVDTVTLWKLQGREEPGVERYNVSEVLKEPGPWALSSGYETGHQREAGPGQGMAWPLLSLFLRGAEENPGPSSQFQSIVSVQPSFGEVQGPGAGWALPQCPLAAAACPG